MVKSEGNHLQKPGDRLPTPLSIALLLTLLTFLLAFFLTCKEQGPEYSGILAKHWYNGFWNSGMIAFAFQMMVILVLGHTLALTAPVSGLINRLTSLPSTTAQAALLITLFSISVSFLNWGLGLITGAIIARRMGESFRQRSLPLNYPLIGAAGYSGLMVWHGGLSGSAPLKIAQDGHFLEKITGVVPVSETLFSPLNLMVAAMVIILLPALMYLLGRKYQSSNVTLPSPSTFTNKIANSNPSHTRLYTLLPGIIIITVVIYSGFNSGNLIQQINPDFINFLLLGFCFLLHRNLRELTSAAEEGMPGAAGILLQFPLYFGIMGIMSGSGLIALVSEWFVSISSVNTFPLFAFFSAGLVNIFVPSGGGQWAIQGPVIAEASVLLGVPVWKGVMAMAYGDQLTNMLQPFWALPLLGITKLKAGEILPWSFILMIAGLVIYSTLLLIF